jgi:hypothetical protein
VGCCRPEGGGEVSLEPLAAVPGQAELRADADPRLEALARLLAERPALGLRLRGGVGPADRRAIAEQILVERATAGGALPEIEGAGSPAELRIAQALGAAGGAEQAPLSPEDRALLERMVGSVEVPPARLQELAQRRAEAVRTALAAQHGVAAWRLPIGEAVEDGEPAVAIELVAAGPAP